MYLVYFKCRKQKRDFPHFCAKTEAIISKVKIPFLKSKHSPFTETVPYIHLRQEHAYVQLCLFEILLSFISPSRYSIIPSDNKLVICYIYPLWLHFLTHPTLKDYFFNSSWNTVCVAKLFLGIGLTLKYGWPYLGLIISFNLGLYFSKCQLEWPNISTNVVCALNYSQPDPICPW